MTLRTFIRLLIWEFEEYWDFPVLEIVLFTAILSLLLYPFHTTFSGRYSVLADILLRVPIFLIFIAAVPLSRSLAGSISRREMVMLLSLPVKRWSVFFSKFIANFFSLFTVFGGVMLINVPLLALNPLEPALYISLMILLIRILFLCTISMTISLVIKSETLSTLNSILLLYGYEFSVYALEPPYKYLSLTEGGNVMFNYLAGLFHMPDSGFMFQDFAVAFLFPILTSAILLVATFTYFCWVMQID